MQCNCRGLCNCRLKLNLPWDFFIYLYTLYTGVIDNKAKDEKENGFSFSVISICVDTCRTADIYGCVRVCFGYVSTNVLRTYVHMCMCTHIEYLLCTHTHTCSAWHICHTRRGKKVNRTQTQPQQQQTTSTTSMTAALAYASDAEIGPPDTRPQITKHRVRQQSSTERASEQTSLLSFSRPLSLASHLLHTYVYCTCMYGGF